MADPTIYAIDYRMSIGPRWHSASTVGGKGTTAADLPFYDWVTAGCVYGGTIPVYTPFASGVTLSAAQATAVPVGVDWPARGGFFAGIGAAGEQWEYIEYSSKYNPTGAVWRTDTAVREPISAEQTGVHTSAAAKWWWLLTSESGQLHVTSQMNQALTVGGYSGKLTGQNAPRHALRNDHLVVIEVRTAAVAGVDWSAWTIAFVGWLQNVHIVSSGDNSNAWSADLVGSDQMADMVRVPGVHCGALDVAPQGQASATSTMAAGIKLSITGETTKAEPLTDATRAIDGDPLTFWASERAVGATNTPNAYGHALDQLHISSYIGQARGTRWIQFPAGPNQQTGWGMRLMNQSGWFAADASGGMLTWNDPHPFAVTEYAPVILCENLLQFKAENPSYGAAQLIEYPGEVTPGTPRIWRKYDPGSTNYYDAGTNGMPAYTGQQWWDSLTAAGGGLLQTVISGTAPEPADGVTAIALWGSQTQAACEWPNAYKTWSGAVLPALTPGQTIRKIHSGSRVAATGWAITNVPTPGYYMDSGQAIGWKIDVPRLDLALTSAITASVPGSGDTLYLLKQGYAGVEGLPTSGAIQIGSEQITYSAKSADQHGLIVTARGASGTTAAIHNAGDKIYFMSGGTATDARGITGIGISRPAGLPTWAKFTTYASALENVRDYAVDGWMADWTQLDDLSAQSSSTYAKTFASARYKHFLVVIYGMTADPYWPMISSFTITEDAATLNANQILAAGSAGSVIAAVAALAGLPASAVHLPSPDTTMSVSGLTTASDSAFNVIADLCEYTRTRAVFSWDGQLYITPDPWWGVDGVPNSTKTWTMADSERLEISFPSRPGGRAVGQVALTWKAPDGSPGGIARYPADPGTGDTVALGPLLFATAGDALAAATKRYWQLRRPYECLVAPAGFPWATVAVGDVQRVLWQPLAQTALTLAMVDRTYLLKGIDYQIKELALESVLHLAQISRSDAY